MKSREGTTWHFITNQYHTAREMQHSLDKKPKKKIVTMLADCRRTCMHRI